VTSHSHCILCIYHRYYTSHKVFGYRVLKISSLGNNNNDGFVCVWAVDVALVATNPLDRQTITGSQLSSFISHLSFLSVLHSSLYAHHYPFTPIAALTSLAPTPEPTAQPRGPFHNLSSSDTTHLVIFNFPHL